MIAKSNNINYVGPKALFDPNYIPPRLLYRKKEEKSLFSILSDSLSDKFCLNILYQGITGIGKKSIVNKVINDLFSQNKDYMKINKICIDCNEKNLEELIFSLLAEINNLSNLNFDFASILNSKISHLWNIFKLACQKNDNHLFLVFNNMEYLEPEIINKFLLLGKDTNITLISTVSKSIRPTTMDIFSEFDFKKKLNFFSYKELYSILNQRVLLSFSHEIDKELIYYITDLICEQYVPVPGKGIEILRDLYPLLKYKTPISQYELLDICQNDFDTFQISDEISMLNYISEEDILTVIFLDNLSNYFMNFRNYYISFKKLHELYDISCEALEFKKNINEFQKLIKDLINIGIIKPSKRIKTELDTYKHHNAINSEFYFILINPKQLQVIIDTIFNQ